MTIKVNQKRKNLYVVVGVVAFISLFFRIIGAATNSFSWGSSGQEFAQM